MPHVFQRPLLPGWVYPCTVEDIEEQIARVPTGDLEGLWAVGLVPSTRKDWGANGRYFSRPKPVIHLCSYQETLCYRLSPHISRADVERYWAVELAYGMACDREGSRWVCRWEAEALRRFALEHVLMHEIGHHVQYRERGQAGHRRELPTAVKEQFAEDYALRRCPPPGWDFD